MTTTSEKQNDKDFVKEVETFTVYLPQSIILVKCEGEKVINRKRHGFLAVAYAFEKYVEAELKKSRYKINNLCTPVLKRV